MLFLSASCMNSKYEAIESVAYLEKSNKSLNKHQKKLDQAAINASKKAEAAKPLNSLFQDDILNVDFQLDQPQIKGSNTIAPKVTRAIAPHYPAEALSQQLEGVVTVSVTVSKKGKAKSVKVLRSTNPIFNDAAIQAAKRWSFKPATFKGKAVSSRLGVPFKFVLKEK